MRRYIMIIGLVVIQVSIVLFFTWQFQKVTTNGVEFRLLTKPDAQDMYTYDITNYYYANFDVNYIKEEQLKSEVTWNDVIYVQLSKENDHYAVKSAHRKNQRKIKMKLFCKVDISMKIRQRRHIISNMEWRKYLILTRMVSLKILTH